MEPSLSSKPTVPPRRHRVGMQMGNTCSKIPSLPRFLFTTPPPPSFFVRRYSQSGTQGRRWRGGVRKLCCCLGKEIDVRRPSRPTLTNHPGLSQEDKRRPCLGPPGDSRSFTAQTLLNSTDMKPSLSTKPSRPPPRPASGQPAISECH